MSSTLTLPLSAGDHFNHGHAHTSPKSSTKLNRSSARLAPPFVLPRIPSESISSYPAPQNSLEQSVTYSSGPQTNRVSTVPSSDPNSPLIAKKRSFEVASMAHTCANGSQHRHVSKPTKILLDSTNNHSLLHGILADNDSRRIFYFMMLNLSFMIVQSLYGYLTGSLGLISDSIHMFFDCVALLVGVCAAVMSKWPPSAKFPYGYGKIDTLAGLGNGIFLMLISIEIVYEAIERLFTGADVSRTTELLLVSSAGLVVNFVGIFAFHGHHHHHGHDHSHHHAPSHSHKSSDTSSIDTAVGSVARSGAGLPAHSHHEHGSENMEGIYLHIMADALGSVAVVVSTLLIKLTGWSGWDPIASFIIAVLIFISTIPLVISTTKILLLSLNSDIEYNLRDVLSGVHNIKGVVGYSVPKFWLEDIKKESTHSHEGEHDHDQHQHHHHEHRLDHHSHTNHEHSHSDEHKHVHLRGDSRDSNLSVPHHEGTKVLGVIHIVVSQVADIRDTRSRVSQYFESKQMDVIVQVEREGEGRCFCGGGLKSF